MKKKNRTALLLFVFILSYGVACEDNAWGETHKGLNNFQDAIATVDGIPITVKAFKKEAARRGGHIPGRFDNVKQREALLDEMIRLEVLAAKAKKAGYDEDPEIVESLKKMMVEKFWRDQVASQLRDTEPTDEEIKDYYEKHLEDYTGPEMARAAVIYLRFPPKASKKDRQELERKAETILKKTKKQTPTEPSFGRLASEYSDDKASKHRGGDIGWVPKNAKIYKWDKPVIDAIFSLKAAGNVSQVIHTSKGLYLVKLMDKREGTVRSLTQVAREIKKKLSLDKRRNAQEQYYQRVKEEFKIQVDKDLLKSLEFSKEKGKSETKPPPFPLNVQP